MILILLTFLMFVLYTALLFYYFIGWQSLKTFDQGTSEINAYVFISVIVPARNEEANLYALLNCLRNQTYPIDKFEVIIIDDHSSDNTAAIVSAFPLSNLKLIKLADHVDDNINSYKKKAIDVAISHSKGELIVTTDADCISKPDWLKTVAAFYESAGRPPMIVMPVLIESNNSLIGIFQTLDFMTLQGVTGGAVQLGLHAMCNGANLAYTRAAFDAVSGFEGIDALASGDDILLMNKMQRQYPGSIRYLKSKNVIVSTSAMPTIRDLMHQRIRWASKTSQYKHEPMLVSAGIVYTFNVLLLLLFASALISNKSHDIFSFTITPLKACAYIFLAKIIVELFFLLPVARFFKQAKQLIYFPLIQPLHILYTVLAGALGTVGKYEWKGREVK